MLASAIINDIGYIDGIAYKYSDKNATMSVCSNYSGYSGAIVIPSMLGHPLYGLRLVTGIESGAFSGCSGLTSITIPNSVTSIGFSAFRGCTGLTSITIPNCLTSIESRTFEGCTGLTFIAIPNNVTSIGDNAFSGCTGLTSVTIPNSVTSIGYSAFSDCTGLTSITIPNSVTSIGDNAFQGCTGLTSVTIPNSVTSIGHFTFDGCKGLTSITIPNSVTSIGGFAFENCSELINVIVAKTTPIAIDYNTFMNRSNATLYVPAGCKAAYEAANYWKEFKEIKEFNITSPIIDFADANVKDICVAFWDTDHDGELSEAEAATITDLGEAFRSNKIITSFNELQYFSQLTSIGEDAFSGCTGLTSITIPNSVTSIGDYTFSFCTGLTSITIPNSVTSIGYSAFSYCTGLTSITIPNSVTSIGENAFSNCTGLTSATIFDGVTSIGYSAFSGCTGLSTVIIPQSVTSIGYGVFNGCYFNERIDLDGSFFIKNFINYSSISYDEWGATFVTEETSDGLLIMDHGLYLYVVVKCRPWATSVTIPNSVTSIGDNAFYGCTGLTSITIPNSVTSIGKSAFDNCTGLTSITIPNSVTSIGEFAFSGCTGLTSITIPNSVTSIGEFAFGDCTGLTSITIPNSVTSIGKFAFRNTGWYDSQSDGLLYLDNWLIDYKGSQPTGEVIIKSGTKRIAGIFDGCTGLTSITIPESVTSIGDFTFYGCTGLTSITIPESVTSIGDYTFSFCAGLTSITIPNSVTSIGRYAFYGCTGLTSVKVDIETPVSIDDNTFSNRANATLIVPAGCKSAYESANYWKEFKEIVEMGTDISKLDNAIYLEPTEAKTGSQKSLSIKMKNTAAIRGFQFDLYLPEGVTVAKTAKGKIVGSLSAGRLPEEDEHSLTFSEQADGAIRFLCSSQYDETFTGNDGEIATLTVNIADNMPDGDYAVEMKNMKLTETDISKYYETEIVKCKLTISSYTLGDINNDGVVDVSDYTGVANHIHGNTPTGFNTRAADVDENGSIDVSDYTGIANIIHTGSIYGGANVRMAIKPKRQKVQENDPE